MCVSVCVCVRSRLASINIAVWTFAPMSPNAQTVDTYYTHAHTQTPPYKTCLTPHRCSSTENRNYRHETDLYAYTLCCVHVVLYTHTHAFACNAHTAGTDSESWNRGHGFRIRIHVCGTWIAYACVCVSVFERRLWRFDPMRVTNYTHTLYTNIWLCFVDSARPSYGCLPMYGLIWIMER